MVTKPLPSSNTGVRYSQQPVSEPESSSSNHHGNNSMVTTQTILHQVSPPGLEPSQNLLSTDTKLVSDLHPSSSDFCDVQESAKDPWVGKHSESIFSRTLLKWHIIYDSGWADGNVMWPHESTQYKHLLRVPMSCWQVVGVGTGSWRQQVGLSHSVTALQLTKVICRT